MRIAAFLCCAILAFASLSPAQQQPNRPHASLSINGSGRVDSGGDFLPSNSNRPGVDTAIVHHVTLPDTRLSLLVEGTPNTPFWLIMGPRATSAIAFGSELVEIDLAQAYVLAAGTLDGQGHYTAILAGGLPAGTGVFHFQAAVFDAQSTTGIATTATVGLEVRNDVETAARVLLDSMSLDTLLSSPSYVDSVASQNFLLRGADRAAGPLGFQLATMMVHEDARRASLVSLDPDFPGSSTARPSGAPSPGQVWDGALTLDLVGIDACSGLETKKIVRITPFRMVEENGVWRPSGDQRDVALAAYLSIGRPLNSNLATVGSLSVLAHYEVTDYFGRNGGIIGVQVSGAHNTPLTLARTFIGGGSQWLMRVPQTSFPALAINGPTLNTANMVVTWNQGQTTSTHTVAFRAPFDLAAIANQGTLMGAFYAPDTVHATVVGGSTFPMIELQVAEIAGMPEGSLGTAFGGLSAEVFSGFGYYDDVGALAFTDGVAAQNLLLCVPGLPSNQSVVVNLSRNDVFGNRYWQELVVQ